MERLKLAPFIRQEKGEVKVKSQIDEVLLAQSTV